MDQPFDQNYDCVHCGKSCTTVVTVSDTKVERLKESGLLLEVEQKQGRSPLKEVDGEVQLTRRRGRCIFLDRQRMCTIHSKLGAEAKPDSCLSFPYLTVGTPDGVSVGLDFTCTAVRENRGKPLSQQRDRWQNLVPMAQVSGPVELVPGQTMGWAPYRQLVSQLHTLFDSVGAVEGIARGLTSAARLVIFGQEVTENIVVAAFDTTPLDLVSGDEIIQDTIAEMAFHLMVLLEARDADEAAEMHQNLLKGFAVRLRRWDFHDQSFKVHRLASRQQMKVLNRFLQNLLARQLLATSPSIYTGLCTLALLPVLFSWYCALSMLMRGSTEGQAEPQDEEFAFDRLEHDFFGRLHDLEPFLKVFAGSFVGLIAPDGQIRTTGFATLNFQ